MSERGNGIENRWLDLLIRSESFIENGQRKLNFHLKVSQAH